METNNQLNKEDQIRSHKLRYISIIFLFKFKAVIF